MRTDNAALPMSVSQEPPPKAEPDNHLHSLLREEEERHERVESRRMLRRVTLVGPVLLAIALLAVAAIARGTGFAAMLVGQAALIFVVLGKFAILKAAILESSGGPGTLGAWEIATLVAYMDISIAVVLIYNLPRLYRLPRLGPVLEDMAEHGLYMLEQHPWLRRITILGVVAFVMFPLTGTGAIGGSIFGRLLGLGPRRTMASIAVGACIGSYGMAYFADVIQNIFTQEVRDSWQFKSTGIAALALMVAIVWWRGRLVTAQLRARRDARRARNGDGPPPPAA